MRDRTKEIIKDGFGCLVNNAAAIRGAKAGPLWLTIVMFVLSVFLPVVPIFTNNITTKGDSFLSSYSYGLERYVTQTALALQADGYEFGVDQNHLLTVTKNGAEVNFDEYGSSKPFDTYYNGVTKEYDFAVYIAKDTKAADKKATYKIISETYYKIETTEIAAYDKSKPEATYRPSLLVLFKDSVYVTINKGSKAVKNSLGGDYKTIKADNAYLAKLLTVKDKEGNQIAPSMTSATYVDGVYKNFKKFLNKSYETLRVRNTFATSGIYLGIFFGLSLVMGLLMWILTRGKNNPNNYYTPWLTMKIQARLGLAPALITLIVGFFLTSYAALIYIATIGLRAMWISMKELRPIAQ